MQYASEKPPHTWWGDLKKQLNWTFKTYDRIEGQQLYLNDMRLHVLIGKVKSDMIAPTKAAINSQLQCIPMNYTHLKPLASYINMVSNSNRPKMSSKNHTIRII